MRHSVSRRHFLAATGAALVASRGVFAQAPPAAAKGPLVCIFSKHLQFLDCGAMAKVLKDIGADGVDLTVRKGGHVVPEKVAADLPRAVDLLRAEGIATAMISTNLCRGDDPDARPILEAASKAGVRYFRIGPQQYAKTGGVLEQLKAFTEEVRSLIRIAEEFNITAGYHNHSGYNNVGAAIWDLHRMIEDIGSKRFGSNFDIGHATVEGAYGAWQTNARLMAPQVQMMAVKDFVWNKDKPEWRPLGSGIVPTAAFFTILRGAGFNGPVSLHFEYKTSSNDALIEGMRNAIATLRAEMKKAGYG
jgi:sugar phosphate isomerase/epimerase